MGDLQKIFASIGYKRLTALVLLVGLLSCNQEGKDIEINKEPVITTFYLIRHSEKDRSDSTNPDPELNQNGLDRAIKWAEVFDPVDLDAIYSTNYERTTMTAAPTSVKKNIDVAFYDPRNIDAEGFIEENKGKNVLVVGHSNTTPMFTNLLIGEEKYPSMDDNDNGSLFIVRIVDGQKTDIRLKID